MYTRPTGKAYVKQHPNIMGWWVVWVNSAFLGTYAYQTHRDWRTALDTALWYNETYYHPTDKEN